MKNPGPGNLLGLAEATNNRAFPGRCRITFRRHHHDKRRLTTPRQFRVGKPAVGTRDQGLEKVRLQAHHQYLTFRIAKADIVFDQLRPLTCYHESGKQDAPERAPFRGHAFDRRPDDFLHDSPGQSGIGHWCRAVGPHATGIRAFITFVYGLVVLGRGQRHSVFAIDEGEETQLFPLEEFFDYDLGARRFTERAFGHDVIYGGKCLVFIATDDDPFAGGEAIRLDDDRCADEVYVILGRIGFVKPAVRRRRNAVAGAEVLGEAFRPFEAGGLGIRAECLDTLRIQTVNKAGYERKLRSDNNKIDPLGPGKGDQTINVFHSNIDAFGNRRDARVSGGRIDTPTQRRSGNCQTECMFAPTRPDNQYFHDTLPLLYRRLPMYTRNAMTDHSQYLLQSDNTPIFSVSEISQAVRQTVEDAFSWVRIQGEISGFKRAASGHLYMALTDQDAVIDGVCWRMTARRLSIMPEDGLEVIATGRMTTYPGRSRYQLVIEAMEIAGQGALLRLFEERRRKLAAEGLFDEAAKQVLPTLPMVIGVVTSPTGAVIHDILHRIRERFPTRVLIWPARVQGNGAADQVAAAVERFNALEQGGDIPRPDVLIVARGGGSLEDLWAFNDEIVVRAVAASEIPLISAIGHEVDQTLTDLAADLRAPTPTAAAEIAVPVRMELRARIAGIHERLVRTGSRMTDKRVHWLRAITRGLPRADRLLEGRAQRLDDWSERLANGLHIGLDHRHHHLAVAHAGLARPTAIIRRAGGSLASRGARLIGLRDRMVDVRATRLKAATALLESYSYRRTLERGFALITDEQGIPVKSSAHVKPGDLLSIDISDGNIKARAVWPVQQQGQGKERPDMDTREKLL